MGESRGEGGEALMARALARYRRGDLAAAQRLYEAALDDFRGLGDEEGQARAMGNLATLLKRQGQGERAAPLLQEAAARFAALGHAGYEADTLRSLSALQLRRGAWLDAVVSYDRALARMSPLTARQRLIRALNRLFLRLAGVG